MGETANIILGILVLGFGFFATAGYGMMPIHLRTARNSFCLTAIFLALIGIELGLMTSWPLGIKVVVAGTFAFVAAGGLIYILNSAPFDAIGVIEKPQQPSINIHFESSAPYETSEITGGRVLSTVRIGLKAVGMSLSNCRVYIEKIAPETPIAGGLPILLEGGGFILRPDDPETLVDVAAHWNHVTKFRFSAPMGGAFFAEALGYMDDNVDRIIEIKISATELQKSATFKIWTDESKKLHLKPM